MIPTPKFKVGDTVYLPGYRLVEYAAPCPDCLGEKTWRVTTPAGLVFDVVCPRCSRGIVFDVPEEWEADVSMTVVTEVRIYSTGTGWSVVYNTKTSHGCKENTVFSTEEEALPVSLEAAALMNDRSLKEARRRSVIPKHLQEKGIAEALHAKLNSKLSESREKYDALVELIVQLPSEIFVRISTGSLRDVAKHLLSESDNCFPEEWEYL